MTASTRPIDVVRGRLHVVGGRYEAFRARCPAHGSRSGTLSVREGNDGTVLLRCYSGCSANEIILACGLRMQDLFPRSDAWRQQRGEIEADRQRFRQTPRETVREALTREIARLHEKIIEERGFDRLLRSAEISAARARIERIYGVSLPPVPPFVWEFAPHDDDRAWPAIFERRLREVLVEELSDPEAKPTPDQCVDAACRAARDLREMAQTTLP